MVGMVPSEFHGAVPIDGYGPGFFRVAGQVFRGALIVTGDGPAAWAGFDDRAALLALAELVDVLFLGLGPDMVPLPAGLAEELAAAGIMVEPMITPSAARSYNVTLTEGRRVACALIPV